MPCYTVKQTDRSVLTVSAKTSPDWKQTFLMMADVHYDNPHCDRRLFRRLLAEAQDQDAGIMIIGDLMDAMQGRNDHRSAKSDLESQYARNNYYDRIIEDVYDCLLPYQANILFISEGNHEAAITRHNETDLLERLCRQLQVPHLGYAGFVRFQFERATGGGRSSKTLWFHHGSGGGGEVTKGTMRAQREAAYIDADIYASGHIHQAWALEAEHVRCTDAGKILLTRSVHLCLPTLKQEFDPRGGYHIEKGRSPRPLGGYWLTFKHNPALHGKVTFTVTKAD